jgi:GNAT superfamily N-acetyltransferase
LSKNLPIAVREVNADDINFILSSWTKSYRHSYFAQKIPNGIYFDEHKKVIAKSLLSSKVFVACLEEEPDQILGYICFDSNKYRGILVVHYLFVKHLYRRFGVGKKLIAAAKEDARHKTDLPIIVTHTTSAFKRLEGDGFVYNPYLMLGDNN